MSDSGLLRGRTSVATFHFKGDLPRFLVPARGTKRKFQVTPVRGLVLYPVERRTSIKDAIEAMGPPHAIVGSILANGQPADFSHRLEPGDSIRVQPLTPPVDVTSCTLLRPDPFGDILFAADANVGKLAARLRSLGFDTSFDPGLDDGPLAELAALEQRIILTKDRTLLKRRPVTHALLILAEDPLAQLVATLRHFGLGPPFRPFSRCITCNGILAPVAKDDVLHLLEPLTKKHYHQFHQCKECGKVFWKGSHAQHMDGWLQGLVRRLSSGASP